jgi:hypothetical protein
MRGGRSVLLCVMLVIAGWVQPVLALTVELRGGLAPLNAEKADFERGGLRITVAGVSSTVIPWDQVRGVTGRPLSEPEKSLLADAEDLWRARARVQRGDLVLASSLLEKHFLDFRGTTSETALIVAEGVLRCRLLREPMRAIVPALEVARLRRAKITTDRYASLPPVIDDATLLCPALAPMWPADGLSDAAANEIDALLAGSASVIDSDTRRAAELYAALLRHRPLAAPTNAVKREEGGNGLLAAILELDRLTDNDAAESKARVRAAAIAAAKGLGPWAHGWVRFAVGRSLTEEKDAGLRMEGVLSLLEIPAGRGAVVAASSGDASGSSGATPGAAVPITLVRASLELAAGTLRAMGDGESAAIIDRELTAAGGSVRQRARPKAVKP